MFTLLEAKLLAFAHTVSLVWFVGIASFVEEVIAPIPSPTVMTLSGSLAQVQGYTFAGLFLLSIVGALGKTLGAVIIYGIANKLEDLILTRFGGFFDVTKDDVAKLSNKLTGNARDYVLMTALRAAPFIPSSVVSVGSGLLKVPIRLYIISTFIGTILRDSIYLFAGYLGLQIIQDLIPLFDRTETILELLVAATVFLGVIVWFVRRKKKKAGNSV